MSDCLTEIMLERVSLNVLADSNHVIPAHINTCNFCESRFLEILNFHREVEKEFKTSQGVRFHERLVQKLESGYSNVYHFDRLHRLPEHQPDPFYTRTLAADSETASKHPSVENIGVYTSHDGRLMIRILKDPRLGYRLFLLSDHEELYRNVLVRIVGQNNDYISDQNGSIQLGKVEIPEPGELAIEVRTPDASYDLENYFTDVGSLIGEKEIQVKYSDDRRYRLELRSVDKKLNLLVILETDTNTSAEQNIRLMVVKKEVKTEVKNFKQGVALFEDIQNPSDIQLKIFA